MYEDIFLDVTAALKNLGSYQRGKYVGLMRLNNRFPSSLKDLEKHQKTLVWHRGYSETRLRGSWEHKHWMSTLGPLYCVDSPYRWRWRGRVEAPNNIEFDGAGSPVIYRQPVNRYELHQVLEAADHDEPESYGVDGDLYWTYETVKAWWAEPHRAVEQEVWRLYHLQCALLEKGEKRF